MRTIANIFTLVRSWDLLAIFYSFLGSMLLAIVLWWAGAFRWIRRKIRHRRGINNYIKSLVAECETLIVVGRRHGFAINDVFIRLDLAPSDLMPEQKELHAPRGSHVLIGGPGAGKSTLAKKTILETIREGDALPFFARLKEYSGFADIEEFLVNKLKAANIPDPEVFLRSQLLSPTCLCVLDGLDEVRPHLRDKTCDDINKFYSKYFVKSEEKILIVTCRKEAYRSIPLNIPAIWEVRPLTDNQIQRFAEKWPLEYPLGKNKDTFWRDLVLTPRILELARSPLLLVGGLMQYTESNLGIPEERVEYLARVGKWLVVDWATAQGHPPDPFRPVYERILSSMAFNLHHNGKSECLISEAKALVRSWLPTFGLPESQADEVLHSIATKTGILVSEGNNNFIFAQFCLQEYFASLELLEHMDVDSVALLEPKNWWRETILFTVARQRNPTSLLQALFRTDLLLAATAVAECPTPATIMQERAIEACLNEIDLKNKAVSSAIVPLLRKITGLQETRLCSELEKRLDLAPEIASLVGLALATAGTSAATNVLGHHPGVWDKCLADAGYLSASFENLLVNWIRSGDEDQSKRAAELISNRLSNDRLVELISLLPSLPKNRADQLASLLLRYLESEGSTEFGYPPSFVFWIISRCTPYVQNREDYLHRRAVSLQEKHGYRYQRRYYSPFTEFESIVSVSLFLESKSKRLAENQILDCLINNTSWGFSRASLLSWVCGSTGVLISMFPDSAKTLLIFIIILAVGVFASFPRSSLPWRPPRLFRRANPLFVNFLLLGCGALAVVSIAMQESSFMKTTTSFVGQKGLALCCLLMGFAMRPFLGFSTISMFEAFEALPRKRKFAKYIDTIIPSLYTVIIITIFISRLFYSGLPYENIILNSSSIFLLFWLMYVIFRLYLSKSLVDKALSRAEKATFKLTL